MKRLRGEDGIALVSALIILVILLGLGIALLNFSDVQQHSSLNQQSEEEAYAVAEAALNAQIFQLNQHWPSGTSTAYPTSCTPASAASTTGCPDPNSLATAYPTTAHNCPANSPGADAWGSSLNNEWTTYVRDDGAGTSQLFSSTTNLTQPTYDAAGLASGLPDGAVWVRAVGVVNCRTAVVVTKVSQQVVGITLPQKAIAANGYGTSNNGNKVIIDTVGTYAQPQSYVGTPSAPSGYQPGEITLRCGSGLTFNSGGTQAKPPATCDSYDPTKKQVQPDTTTYNSSSPSVNLTQSQLTAIRNLAIVNGTWWGAGSPNGTCPASVPQLTGAPTFIDGPCNLNFKTTGTAIANSSASPGFMVLNNGTLTLDGTAVFYGVIYANDAQGASPTPCKNNADTVSIQGNAEVQGAIIVDNNGTVCIGSSGNGNPVTNFVYDARGFLSIKGWGGAAATPNSFRLLPQGQ